ncbi:prepilin peptidase [Streptococcus chenjunshii]|uniref:Prepilin peptidase n=1 Tax=Streptococcus chenjunshii TaxID=2173853 RepID=A0A372KPB2_9STRE|nr:A24 family peptidase [Streptococcus chenjunshii]AXQ78198.1 prepilin peptidase [Streptococcus chenjunshii]RFU50931.1 prepilin peptidase [Streptococcus chenjunshii]RFU53428.1 prepilin peptidase [Streptococcus chenjunshii]
MKTFLYFFLGASIASFLGVVIKRFPNESIIVPRSRCDSCGQTLSPRDLVPLVSQIVNRFRCRFCKSRISFWYCFFEGACGLAFILWSAGLLTAEQLLLLIFSCVLSIYDIREQSYPLLIWGCFVLPLLYFGEWNIWAVSLFLLGIAGSFINMKMGSGDFLYLAALALAVDSQKILWIIQLSSLSGIFFMLFFCKQNKAIPFVPFLATAYLLLTAWELIF